jgi:8-oxo-dGTP pyrophosphatase MutT (NUDIX family)
MSLEPDLLIKLKEVLAKRQKAAIRDPHRRPSAVLIPVYYYQGQHIILFTKRSELVHYHKGEISFPGGGFHPKDGTLLNTALRESYEEIGLSPSDVQVLGELDDSITKGSDYIITPFVGSILPEYKFKLNDFETAEIIRIPLAALLEEGCRREEPVIVLDGQKFIPYVYAYQGHLIIGATARILMQLLDIMISLDIIT